MSATFTREQTRIFVAKILVAFGFSSVNSRALDFVTDIAASYFSQLGKMTNMYANELGQTDPNLDHVYLAFRQMGIDISDLKRFVTKTNFFPPPEIVPKYPVAVQSNLNFLKPGSREVLGRPIHINDYLPPMYPNLEDTHNEPEQNDDDDDVMVVSSPREITSVMMTSSGFLCPVLQGKLPESCIPFSSSESTTSQPESVEIDQKVFNDSKEIPIVCTGERKSTDYLIEQIPSCSYKVADIKIENNDSNCCKELTTKPSCSYDVTGFKNENSYFRSVEKTTIKPSCSYSLSDDKNDYSRSVKPSCSYKNTKFEPRSVKKLPTKPNKKKMEIFKKITKSEKRGSKKNDSVTEIKREYCEKVDYYFDDGVRSDLSKKPDIRYSPPLLMSGKHTYRSNSKNRTKLQSPTISNSSTISSTDAVRYGHQKPSLVTQFSAWTDLNSLPSTSNAQNRYIFPPPIRSNTSVYFPYSQRQMTYTPPNSNSIRMIKEIKTFFSGEENKKTKNKHKSEYKKIKSKKCKNKTQKHLIGHQKKFKKERREDTSKFHYMPVPKFLLKLKPQKTDKQVKSGRGRPSKYFTIPDETAPSTSRCDKTYTRIIGDKTIWICPACDQFDNGTAMIQCDDCDEWFHWTCVGIEVAPDEKENWYCRHCLIKRLKKFHFINKE